MAIPPFVNTRLNKGEKLTQEKAEELFDAMTRNFEDLYNRVQTQEAANEAGNEFLRLLTKGKRKITWGEATLTWTASKASAKVEVTHKLGAAPSHVSLQLENPNAPFASGISFDANLVSRSSTKFIIGGTCSEAISASFGCLWLAIA